jgi:ribosomal protein L3 glutamine methyltransferase
MNKNTTGLSVSSGAGNIKLSSNTVLEVLKFGEALFSGSTIHFGHGTDNAWDEAVSLLLHALDFDFNADRSILDMKLNEQQIKDVIALYNRRVDECIPAPYLTGQAWFCGLPFVVDSRVIIPRSPIAQLIINYFQPWLVRNPERILDLCCGGGCIGISCAYGFDQAEIVLSDISLDALSVADINIEKHNVGSRVCTVHSDLFSDLDGQSFDLIVSNPPYVNLNDFNSMPNEFHHEPELALYSGSDGLDFTRRLLREAAQHLSDEGILIVEVGNSAEALENAFPSVPFFWFEFAEGDGGVFMLSRSQLIEFGELF